VRGCRFTGGVCARSAMARCLARAGAREPCPDCLTCGCSARRVYVPSSVGVGSGNVSVVAPLGQISQGGLIYRCIDFVSYWFSSPLRPEYDINIFVLRYCDNLSVWRSSWPGGRAARSIALQSSPPPAAMASISLSCICPNRYLRMSTLRVIAIAHLTALSRAAVQTASFEAGRQRRELQVKTYNGRYRSRIAR